jgi:signal transduction histidine kinase
MRKPGQFKARPASFFWQGLLILLPVGVLALVGFLALRNDRLLAEAQARQQAREIACDLAEVLWTELTATNEGPGRPWSFRLDQAGHLAVPPPVPGAPAPAPLDPAELKPDQAALWNVVRAAAASDAAFSNAAAAWQTFIQSQPPPRFGALAEYSLALLLARQGDASNAVGHLESLNDRFADAVGESGLPLLPLARLKRLELAAAMGEAAPVCARLLESLGSNLVEHPTLLTPRLLGEMSVSAQKNGLAERGRHWQQEWEKHEQERRLHSAARAEFQTSPLGSKAAFPNLSVGTGPGQVLSPSSREGEPLTNLACPRLFWFTTHEVEGNQMASSSPSDEQPALAEQSWLAVRHVEPGGWKFDCWSVGSFRLHFGVRGRRMTNRVGTRNFVNDVVTPSQPWMAILSHAPSVGPANLALLTARATDRCKGVPRYFGIGLPVAGRELLAQNDRELPGGPGGWLLEPGPSGWGLRRCERALPVYGSFTKEDGGIEALRVRVYLADPESFFAAQTNRQRWFGLLIAVAAAAALSGFLSAWRAFVRQQRLNDMKSNFVSSVSHELRAPIASVRLMAESLERGKVAEPAKQREYFRFILQECRRLSALIENVLDFSRIEQGRKEYEFEPTDVGALVEATVKLMEPVATEKQVRLALERSQISDLKFQISVDGRALQQALVNLLDNAIKHSPAGETVTIRAEVRARGTGVPPVSEMPLATSPAVGDRQDACPTVCLSVSDHGPGIPPEEHERIFERFYRRGSELRRETPGVGIGLSLVKHIVEAHGGRVRVASEIGKGSCFTLELPLSP